MMFGPQRSDLVSSNENCGHCYPTAAPRCLDPRIDLPPPNCRLLPWPGLAGTYEQFFFKVLVNKFQLLTPQEMNSILAMGPSLCPRPLAAHTLTTCMPYYNLV